MDQFDLANHLTSPLYLDIKLEASCLVFWYLFLAIVKTNFESFYFCLFLYFYFTLAMEHFIEYMPVHLVCMVCVYINQLLPKIVWALKKYIYKSQHFQKTATTVDWGFYFECKHVNPVVRCRSPVTCQTWVPYWFHFPPLLCTDKGLEESRRVVWSL